MFKTVTNIVMAHFEKSNEHDQVGVTEGIKRHGSGAVAAVINEYKQLRDLDTVMPLKSNSLSNFQKCEALNLITLIKKKRRGKIKARVCANGRKQRRYIQKDEVASPTVQLESLITTMVIDALETTRRGDCRRSGSVPQNRHDGFRVSKSRR